MSALRRAFRFIAPAILLTLMAPVLSCSPTTSTTPAPAPSGPPSSVPEAPAPPQTLREAAGGGLLFGTAILAGHLDDSKHAKLIAEQFNCITPGNEMKPDALQRVEGRFTFERADRIVAFAQANNMEVIGHTLVWHSQAPAWLFEDAKGRPHPRQVALANMKNHITTVMRHYKGRVKGWDVVNEAIPDGPGDLRDTPARRAIGDDFVLKAFEFAMAADPDAELYYNDYNIDHDYKRDRALRLVRQIRDAGLRIDAVGIQGHYMLENPSISEIKRGITAYVDAGFKVMITELDVDPLPRKGSGGADLSATEREGLDPYRAGFPPAMQTQLADRYHELFTLFLRFPQLSRVTIWGTTDGNTWLNDFPVSGRTNHPMLWDRSYDAKPAYHAVYRALMSVKRTDDGTATPPSAR